MTHKNEIAVQFLKSLLIKKRSYLLYVLEYFLLFFLWIVHLTGVVRNASFLDVSEWGE